MRARSPKDIEQALSYIESHAFLDWAIKLDYYTKLLVVFDKDQHDHPVFEKVLDT